MKAKERDYVKYLYGMMSFMLTLDCMEEKPTAEAKVNFSYSMNYEKIDW